MQPELLNFYLMPMPDWTGQGQDSWFRGNL